MLSEAQKRIAQLLDIPLDTTDTTMIEIIDDALMYEARKGPLELAKHLFWVLKNRF